MDRRKRLILQAITDDYIASAEPVGSRTIARKHGLGVSPATIRNEMADLEEAGYLEQPHTSAGRIPSDKGYRFYVDTLIDPTAPTQQEKEQLRTGVRPREDAIDQIVHRTARLLSYLTQYTAVIIVPSVYESICRHVQVIALDNNHLLLVLVTEPGYVQNRIVELDSPISEEDLLHLNDVLSKRLRGVSLRDITATLINELRHEIARSHLFQTVMELLLTGLDSGVNAKLYLEGTTNMFEHPEFQNVERAKVLLRLLDEREAIASLIDDVVHQSGTNVTIGREHRREEMHECSMVTATVSIKDHVIGTFGLLGPTRMDYARVIGILQYVADGLSETLTHYSRR